MRSITFRKRLCRLLLSQKIEVLEMCEFCKNIYTKDYTSTKYKDYIYKDEHGVYIHFATGDSFMDFDYEINNCPKCGRKLVEE